MGATEIRSASSGSSVKSAGGEDVRLRLMLAQTPPDVKVIISRGEDELLIKLVSLDITSRGSYLGNTEYWRYHHDINEETLGVEVLSMSCQSIINLTTEAQIDAIFDDFTAGFSHDRVITAAGWSQGAREIPNGRRAFLFSGPDPDDEEKQIGVLIEQSVATDAIVAVVWYKTWVPENCQIWSAEAGFTIELRRVMNGANPSTNPAHIPGNAQSWYRTLMGTP